MAAASLLYTALDRTAQAALNAHFRRVRVAHPGRFPGSGPVLLVANHPSAWADAVVLLGAFERKLHFLVQGDQFHPWPRGLLLRLFGALPVYSRDCHPEAAAKNAETFRRCEALFDRGDAVAVFPEGVSASDRALMPLRLGAARLALSYARRAGARPLPVVAVGIHYSDRVAFRSDVSVNVGEAIATADLLDTGGEEVAAVRLTERIGREIRALALGAARPRQAALLAALEPIAASVAERQEVDSPAEILARSLEDLEREDPDTYRQFERRALAQERIRRALRVSDRALTRSRKRRPPVRAVLSAALTALGALPAAIGALIHAIPAALTGAATRRIAETPAQVAFVRIAAGTIFFAATYAGFAWLFFFRLAWGAQMTAGALVCCALLGACAVAYTPHAREWSERWRLGWIALRHMNLVCRANREEEWLRRRVEALLEYGLEVANVDPAYPPVLELGARPSPLPR
jgi:glycerol-3-phosphate O-acyltransferase / dihydroxyacetone phosphate acyltransferase